MSRRHAEGVTGPVAFPDGKRHQTGSMVNQIVTASLFQFPVFSQLHFFKTCLLKLPLHTGGHMEGRSPLLGELQEFSA